MRKAHAARPMVEGLEPKQLLSALPAPALDRPTVARPAPAADEATPVELRGTIRGVGSLYRTQLAVRGVGNLGAVGLTSLRDNGNLLDPPSTVVIATRRGSLILAITSAPVVAGQSASVTYAIAGGNKIYAHATGAGTVTGSITLRPDHKVRFTATFS